MPEARQQDSGKGHNNPGTVARSLCVTGRVQGVGFRPHVYHVAQQCGVEGWVRNLGGAVEIQVQGGAQDVHAFVSRLTTDLPGHARIENVRSDTVPVQPLAGFRIVDAGNSGAAVHISPDYGICRACLADLHDSGNRRYLYPFTHCTQCGPRYSVMQALPYQRRQTSMGEFPLCARCLCEYNSPANRRFHAEMIACEDCGPQTFWLSPDEIHPLTGRAAMEAAVEHLQQGNIVALKGVGGYHLACDARNPDAVARLRQRKQRPHKPLAIMICREALRNCMDMRACDNWEQPVVLVDKGRLPVLADNLAPGVSELGVMVPYSPLHEIILHWCDGPLVMTSGNRHGEPVIIDNIQAEQQLTDIADGFLHHNRCITRHVDDSVVRCIQGRLRPLRLGRGHAPLEMELPFELPEPVVALGGQDKVTCALAWQDRVVMSQHIGNVASPRALQCLQNTVADLCRLYRVQPDHVLHDAHPGYTTHGWRPWPVRQYHGINHHFAHASACMAESDMQAQSQSLVFTWDGNGLGADGSLWGGEALLGRPGHWRQVASMRRVRLPGGERAQRELWRSAWSMCWDAGVGWAQGPAVPPLIHQAWQRNINSPQTSAVGRLFDAAASLTGVLHNATYDGQGPMWLEALAEGQQAEAIALPLVNDNEGVWRTDWSPLVPVLIDDTLDAARRAAIFHESLARALLDQALLVRRDTGINHVGLCGGVFQNRILTERAVALLEQQGFSVCLPERLPVNDGALALGQIIEFAAQRIHND